MKVSTIFALLLMFAATIGFAEGDAKNGKKVFKKCKACHSLKPEDNKVGPTLYNVIGTQAGSVEGFRYSKAMTQSELIWDMETLSAFLTRPKDVVPRTSMSFAGLKKVSDVDDLIAYLQSEMEE